MSRFYGDSIMLRQFGQVLPKRAFALSMACLVFTAGAFALPPATFAQGGGNNQYRVLPLPEWAEDTQRRNQLRSRAITVRNDGSGERFNDEANRRALDQYYTYLLIRMTQPNERGNLDEIRHELVTDLFRASNERVRQHLVGLIYSRARALMGTQYHPVVRYNATLLVGQLDQQPAPPGRPQPPVPHQEALGVLLQAYEQDDQIEAVKVAALLGILRHAQVANHRWNEATRNRVVTAMYDLVRQDASNSTNPEAHVWMQRRAMEILAATGEEGDNGQIVLAIADKMSDPDAPLYLRLTAAYCLGQFEFEARNRPEALETAGDLGSLAVAACRQELDRVDAIRRREAESRPGRGGGMDTMYGPGMGMYEEMYDEEYGMPGGMPGAGRRGPGDPEYKMNATRRQIKYYLYCVQRGLVGDQLARTTIQNNSELEGVGKLAAGDEQQLVRQIAEKIQDIMLLMDRVSESAPAPGPGPRAPGRPRIDDDVFINLEELTTETRQEIINLAALARQAGSRSVPDSQDLEDELEESQELLEEDPAPAGPGQLPGDPEAGPGPGQLPPGDPEAGPGPGQLPPGDPEAGPGPGQLPPGDPEAGPGPGDPGAGPGQLPEE